MPAVVHTTDTFDQLLDAVQQQGIKISGAKCGVEIPLKGVKAEFLAPNAEDYENLNDYSAVLKLTYGEQAFLFTGDAQELSENEMLANGQNLQASILKIGHHGSSSSSSAAFLQAVSPQIAVISCGLQNDYGHPHREVLQRLVEQDIKVLRTDLHGTITIKSNGKSITISVKEAGGQKEWIGNKNSKVVHHQNCSNLPHPKNRIYFDSLDEAYQLKYRACPNCIAGGN
ncbi:MAG TPA: MBL fold metallo-hydrolase, partial [Syntrophomonadaceae bacterium]|nr:MBL fold metallo-hydrolase [Syntrophomonadaceae bacterium]